MEFYDYRENVLNDILDYIEENIDLSEWAGRKDELEEYLNDELWTVDSVTGNASGSYFCNRYRTEEALCHNGGLYDDVVEDYCAEPSNFYKNPERADVSIRCYLLGECISEALNRLDIPEIEAVDEDDEDESPVESEDISLSELLSLPAKNC